jgi:hypothetical protein
MKKNLLLSFLMVFALSTALLAGVSDPKNETDKVSAKNNKENKLSDEELSRMNKKTEGKYNLTDPAVSKSENNSLMKSTNANQIVIEEGHHHHHYWYGGLGLVLVVILIVVLV